MRSAKRSIAVRMSRNTSQSLSQMRGFSRRRCSKLCAALRGSFDAVLGSAWRIEPASSTCSDLWTIVAILELPSEPLGGKGRCPRDEALHDREVGSCRLRPAVPGKDVSAAYGDCCGPFRVVGQDTVDVPRQRNRYSIRIAAFDLHAIDERAGIRVCRGGVFAADHRQSTRERLLHNERQALAERWQNQDIAALIKRHEGCALQIGVYVDVGQSPGGRINRSPAGECKSQITPLARQALDDMQSFLLDE